MTEGLVDVPSGDPVVVEYELAREDVVPAIRWQLGHQSRIWKQSLLGFPLAGLGALFISWGGRTNATAGGIVIGLCLWTLIFYWVIYFVMPHRAWGNVASSGPKTLEFSDQGVRIHGRDTDIAHRWSAYSQMFETDEVYLLRLGAGGNTFVPKRSFRSPTDELQFRSLAQRHIATAGRGSQEAV